MTHDGLSADCLQMINFLDLPALGFGIVLGSLLVVLRAFAPGLVFGRDPNPDADGLRFVHFFNPEIVVILS
jgi:hypothetical protein